MNAKENSLLQKKQLFFSFLVDRYFLSHREYKHYSLYKSYDNCDTQKWICYIVLIFLYKAHVVVYSSTSENLSFKIQCKFKIIYDITSVLFTWNHLSQT